MSRRYNMRAQTGLAVALVIFSGAMFAQLARLHVPLTARLWTGCLPGDSLPAALQLPTQLRSTLDKWPSGGSFTALPIVLGCQAASSRAMSLPAVAFCFTKLPRLHALVWTTSSFGKKI